MSDFLDEIECHIPSLRRYARALTGDAEWTDDLVQDVLERAIRKRHLFKPKTTLRAWLFTILNNQFRNDLRARSRRPRSIPIDDLAAEPAQPPEAPHRLELMETAEAIGQLSAEQRQALLLVALEGFLYKEAAAILGIAQGTLMSRLGRARANLKKLVEESGGKSTLRRVK